MHLKDHNLNEKIGRVRLASRVYNFSQAQVDHASAISLYLLHKRMGHLPFSVLGKYLSYSKHFSFKLFYLLSCETFMFYFPC